ncbi:uncharacterized protein LAJ45_09717 [Morchella importuna]|uniref:uncharacterized protein n=1 Tax=Morchella importuna TaxID=1174673 RepID=UPI001E8E825E|nr:uncharacterized protein LAJ45_09717 [Morchella importuna]KAH8146275.1 hypothetical protein LAJ45_09717 [Morchella importuna]
MPSPPSHPHKLQRRYFPNTVPNCTSTHSQTHLDTPHNTAPNTVPNTVPNTAPNTAPNTVPIAILMMSTTRASNRRVISRPRIQPPNTFFSDYPIPTPRYFTESPPASPSPPIMGAHPPILATPLPTPQPTPQPSQSTKAQHEPDVEPPFSPILPLHRSDSHGEDEREKEREKGVKPEVDEFDEDESEWQDAQIRESQLSDREDKVIDVEEEDGNDEWVDDDDWHSAETQDEWVEMERIPLSESRDI